MVPTLPQLARFNLNMEMLQVWPMKNHSGTFWEYQYIISVQCKRLQLNYDVLFQHVLYQVAIGIKFCILIDLCIIYNGFFYCTSQHLSLVPHKQPPAPLLFSCNLQHDLCSPSTELGGGGATIQLEENFTVSISQDHNYT